MIKKGGVEFGLMKTTNLSSSIYITALVLRLWRISLMKVMNFGSFAIPIFIPSSDSTSSENENLLSEEMDLGWMIGIPLPTRVEWILADGLVLKIASLRAANEFIAYAISLYLV